MDERGGGDVTRGECADEGWGDCGGGGRRRCGAGRGDGAHNHSETKGREDVDVAHKDRAAKMWCENATLLTETHWEYVKVPQKEFEKLEATEFSDLTVFVVP